jgi:hypothetical protein
MFELQNCIRITDLGTAFRHREQATKPPSNQAIKQSSIQAIKQSSIQAFTPEFDRWINVTTPPT